MGHAAFSHPFLPRENHTYFEFCECSLIFFLGLRTCRRLLNLMWWDSETRTELGTIVTGIWDTILFGTWVGFDSGPDKCD
jgi:hypothetical protein